MITELFLTELLEPVYVLHPIHPESDEYTVLLDSIRVRGVLIPIDVNKISDGRFVVLDGKARVHACHDLGKKTIPAVVHHVSEAVAEEWQMLRSLHHCKVRKAYNQHFFQRLTHHDPTLTLPQLKSMFGVTTAWLVDQLGFQKFPTAIVNQIATGKITITNAIYLSKATPDKWTKLAKLAETTRHHEFGPMCFATKK